MARDAVEARGGSVVELRGDEALGAFGSARQAILAAVELQLACVEETARDPAVPLSIGIGLDAGEAVPVEGGFRGGALNLAARLCGRAEPGEVLASPAVVHLARAVDGIRYRELGPVTLKGLDDPVEAVAIVAAESPRPIEPEAPREASIPAPLDPVERSFVGRDRELHWLRGMWRRAARGHGRILLVSGAEGSGKTMLCAELARFAVERGAAEIRHVSGRELPETVVAALRRGAEAVHPTLLVVDDLHHAPATVVEALLRTSTGIETRPVLVVAAYTVGPDAALLGNLPDRIGGREESHRRLGPLDGSQVLEIARSYAGAAADRLPLAGIMDATGGLPRRVHREVSEWVRDEKARALGKSAVRTGDVRSRLRSSEGEVVESVADLQRLHSDPRGRSIAEEAVVCPFKGLASFEADDAEYYFGRERLVGQMVARLVGTPLMGIVGPSGSGKSSALKAGLLPTLAAGVLPGSARWHLALARPGAHPMESVRDAVRRSVATSPMAPARTDDAPDPTDLLGWVPAGETVVIAVDQFEEVFTVCRDQEEREAFVSALTAAAGDGRAVVVLAIRADLYGRCAAHPDLADQLSANHVLVGPMTAEELRRAIELPARKAGLRVEPELVDALVADVVEEPGGLPLLSTTLLELWQERDGRSIRMKTYERTGGVRGAVARLAERAFDRLSDEQQSVARAVLVRLADVQDGAAPVRRRVPLEELDAGREDVGRVVAALAESRLLTLSEGSVELAHEALIREWPRLRGWLEEDVHGRRLHRHVAQAAREWHAGGRDPAELYRGARLTAALDWSLDHRLELNRVEEEFLNESRAAAGREADRVRRSNRRLRALLAGVVLLLVAAVVAGGIAEVQSRRARTAARISDARRLGAEALTEDNLARALLLAREAVLLDDSVETRSDLLATILRSPAATAIFHGDGDRIHQVALSPDGRLLAMGDNDGTITIVDTVTSRRSGDPIQLPEAVTVVDLDFAPGGETLAISAGHQYAAVWDVDARGELARIDGISVAPLLEHLPDGRLFVFEPLGSYFVWDPASGRRTNERWIGRTGGSGFSISPDGSWLVTPGDRTSVWDVGSGEEDRSIGMESVSVAVSPDGTILVAGGPDGSVTLADESGVRDFFGRHSGRVESVAFTPDGHRVVTTGNDGTAMVWDVASGRLEETLARHGGPAVSLAVAPDGHTVYTGSLDSTVIAWDLSGKRRLGRELRHELTETPAMAISADGTTLAVVERDEQVGLYALASLEALGPPLAGRSGPLFSVAFSPDGTTLAMSGRDAVEFWDLARRERLGDPVPARDDAGPFGPVAFRPRDDVAAVGTRSRDSHVVLFEVPSLREVGRWPAAPGAVEGLEFSPDGAWLATGTRFAGTVVWSVEPPHELVLRIPGDGPAVAFTGDGRRLAAGGSDGVVRLWDVASRGGPGTSFGRHAGRVSSVDFGAGDRILATTGMDGAVLLWDVESGQRIGPALPGSANAAVARFTPEGTELVALHGDGRTFVWEVDPQRWMEHACRVARRDLSPDEWSEFLPDRPYRPTCAALFSGA